MRAAFRDTGLWVNGAGDFGLRIRFVGEGGGTYGCVSSFDLKARRRCGWWWGCLGGSGTSGSIPHLNHDPIRVLASHHEGRHASGRKVQDDARRKRIMRGDTNPIDRGIPHFLGAHHTWANARLSVQNIDVEAFRVVEADAAKFNRGGDFDGHSGHIGV